MRSHHIHGMQFWWRAVALFGAMPLAIGCQLGTGGSPGLGGPGLGAKTTDGQGGADYDPAIAFLKLSEIKPVPILATPTEAEQIEIPPQGVRSMTGAEELLREGRFTEAMFELEKALRFAPKSFEIHTRLALVCRQAGNDGRALSHITRAAEIRPDSVVCHYLLGRHRVSEGKSEEAIAEFRLALASGDATEENPYRSLTHFFLGTALEQKGYLSASLEQFDLFAVEPAIAGIGIAHPPSISDGQQRETEPHCEQEPWPGLPFALKSAHSGKESWALPWKLFGIALD